MLLRVLLFGATNFAIMIVLSIVWQALGIDQWLAAQGLSTNIVAVLPMALAFGMGGSLVSLFISKWMALRSTGAHVIKEPRNSHEQWLVDTVRRQAERAGIGMPDVAIYEGKDPNAFATGASRNNALVAVSTGLLRNMSQDEVEAVLAHEVSHVANGDMITLTLLQGILNTFVIIFARIIGMTIDKLLFKTERGVGPGYYIGYFAAQILLSILAQIIVMWFSRYREFRADSGGANLAGRQKMISALQRLQSGQPAHDLPEEIEAFGISGRKKGGLARLFMSHPPLEERIAALQSASSTVR